MRVRAFLFIWFMVINLGGCGYTTRSVLSSGESSIYVENFINKIDVTRETSDTNTYYAYRPAVETDITREIIDRFVFDGNYKILGPDSAKFILKGELVDFRRDSLGYDADENVTEYRLRLAVDMELLDLGKNESIWRERYFAGESTYRTTGERAASEDTAVEEAVKDLARRVVERTVENW